VGWERLAVRHTTDIDDVPPRIEAVTPAWLTGALCAAHPGARVEDVRFGMGSSGTSVRRQLLLTYNDAGTDAGLPPSVFAKSTPSVLTRMANGATGVSPAEAGFYREIRPLLDVRAPVGFHSAVDPRTFRSIHLLEDLVATSDATFCTPTTPISRAQAEEVVTTLATLHGTPALRPFIDRPPGWLPTYSRWWERGISTAAVRRYHRKGFREAADVVPPELHGKGDDLWQAFLESVAAHHRLPPTLLHGDVHLGNWYIDGSGAMGLCDWQCICIGNGSRDLAYAVATALSVEDRRAWEHDLVGLYVDRLRSAGGASVSIAETWDAYRSQLPGALLMWTPTHSPPPMMPNMQPREVAREMIRRITTAISDHGIVSDPIMRAI
jgi:aminoglycoside phosphotransferase (APT) family kinase protein